MSLTRRIAHNTGIQFAGKIIGTLIALVTISIMLRYLGKEGFGQYATAINFLSVFAILIDLGLYLIVTREISKPNADEEKLISNTLTFRLTVGIVILSLAPLIGLFMPYAPITKWAILVNSSAFLFMSLNQILTGLFQKHLRMDKVSIGEVVGRLFWLASVLIIVKLDLGLLWIVGTNAIAALINFLLLFIFSRKFTRVRLAFDFKLWRDIWVSATPLAINVILNLVYFKAGIIALSIMDTEEAVGTLGAAQKILENLIAFSAIFAGLLFPLFAKYIFKDKKKFERVYKKGFDAIAMLVIPLVAGTIVLAERIVVFFGGEEFQSSAGVLSVLMIAVGAIFFGNLFGNAIVAADIQKRLVKVYIVNAALAVGISITLIPYLSYYGAAISTLVTEIIVAFAAAVLVYKHLKLLPSFVVFFKSLFAAALMLLTIVLIPESVNLILTILAGGVVYFVALFVIGGVSKEVVMEVVAVRRGSGAVEKKE
ncbi:flippase [Patescibacteria group bacterium]|nr:flippase [Patescibacteria group bacterium]